MHYLCEGHKHRCATEMKCRSVGADAKVWTTTNTMKLFHNEMSPPSRAVLLTAKALGIEMETQEVDLENQENLTPEFLQVSLFFAISIRVDDAEVWSCFRVGGDNFQSLAQYFAFLVVCIAQIEKKDYRINRTSDYFIF